MLHQFIKDDICILYDNVSGVLFETDKVGYDVARTVASETDAQLCERFCGIYPEEDILKAAEELRSLIAQELMLEEEKIYAPSDNFGLVKALCLNVAHDCDLRCAYCFAAQGSFHQERGLMDVATAKRAVDFLIENSGKRKNLEIDFFGGEPLLNFEVVKQTVHYAKERARQTDKEFKFTLTTNGLKLDEDIGDFLNEHMDNVVLSLDGRKEIHDTMRPCATGQESYDIIIKNILRFLKKRGDKEYYVRGTYTALNKDFSNDVVHLSDLGIKHISIEPVSSEEGFAYGLSEEDIALLDREYAIIAKEYLARQGTDKAFSFFHFYVDLEGAPCVYKKISGCGAATDYMVVSVDGRLYPCHQFDSVDEMYMGDVWQGIVNQDIGRNFFDTNILTKEACQTCWAKYHCGGGCYAASYKKHQNIHQVDEIACEILKKRLEYALALKVVNAKKS